MSEEGQSIGDILLSKQIQLYDLQRVGREIVLRGDKPHAAPRLINHFDAFSQVTWKGARVRPGLLLSGEKLIDDKDYRDQLVALQVEAVGGEMEGAGLYVASADHKVDWIVVKAICDWADGNKKSQQEAAPEEGGEERRGVLVESLKYAPLTHLDVRGGDPAIFAAAANSQVKSVTSKLSEAAKYIPALYVERDLEADIHNFLNKPVTGKSPHCFLLIAPAGCGKTSLLCHVAEQSSERPPDVLLLGAQLRIEGQDSFLFGMRDHLKRAGISFDANRSVVSCLVDVCRQTKSTVVVIVDGINEYHDPTQLRREIGRVLEDTSHTGVKLVFSCRDFYWGLFKASYWQSSQPWSTQPQRITARSRQRVPHGGWLIFPQ